MRGRRVRGRPTDVLTETRFHDVRCDGCSALLARDVAAPTALAAAEFHRDGAGHRCACCRTSLAWTPESVAARLVRAFARHPHCAAVVAVESGVLAFYDPPDGWCEASQEAYDAGYDAMGETARAVERWLGVPCSAVTFILDRATALALYANDGGLILFQRPAVAEDDAC